MVPATVFLLCAALCVVVVGSWWLEAQQHGRRLRGLGVRVHVNGTRGKSSVTRLIAGALRGAGIPTVGKTTGSAAAILTPEGEDVPIRRRGQPTILEQLEVVRYAASRGAEALVVECMALDPGNQATSETHMVRSTIGVLTNVREDHQDVMGTTLADIARSLLNTCPRDGVLITAEHDPAILALLEDEARARGSRLIEADPAQVTPEDLARFDHVAFADNVAIALEVAKLQGIDRATAMDGMVAARPDPGVLRYKTLRIGGKRVTWINLFAINDAESVIQVARRSLEEHGGGDTTTVGLLNNRLDREERARQFADIASFDLQFDRLALLGAYERFVRNRLVDNGYPEERVLSLGDRHRPSLEQLLGQLVEAAPTEHVALVGMVNIHTAQAEMLLDYFEGEEA